MGSGKVTFKMLENFTRLLSSLLAAGVPLSRALVILYREAVSPAAGEKWKAVHDLVVDGMSLANAMARFPETFPRVYVAMVEAGETGGFLDLVLGQIADFQSRDKELRGKVFSAMIYPVVLLFLALGVLVFLMMFFIPRFKVLFEGFDYREYFGEAIFNEFKSWKNIFDPNHFRCVLFLLLLSHYFVGTCE